MNISLSLDQSDSLIILKAAAMLMNLLILAGLALHSPSLQLLLPLLLLVSRGSEGLGRRGLPRPRLASPRDTSSPSLVELSPSSPLTSPSLLSGTLMTISPSESLAASDSVTSG